MPIYSAHCVWYNTLQTKIQSVHFMLIVQYTLLLHTKHWSIKMHFIKYKGPLVKPEKKIALVLISVGTIGQEIQCLLYAGLKKKNY